MRGNFFLVPFVAAGLALTACGDSSGPRMGRLSIQLTDAPGDLAEAHIRIDQFVLLPAGSDDDDGEGSGRIELEPEVGDYISLLSLSGGQVLEIVDRVLVPTGTYSELRLVVDEAYVVLEDGRVFATAGADLPIGITADGTLQCPSCSQSGYKVKFMDGGLTVLDDAAVLIDFDVAQSFGQQAGASGMWVMRPVLRATSRTVQFARVVGNVTLATDVTLPAECGGDATAITQFRPFAVAGDDTITGTVDEAGAFMITGLLPGTYTLGHWEDITFTDGDILTFAATPTPASVTVAEGDEAAADYEITAATCEAP